MIFIKKFLFVINSIRNMFFSLFFAGPVLSMLPLTSFSYCLAVSIVLEHVFKNTFKCQSNNQNVEFLA